MFSNINITGIATTIPDNVLDLSTLGEQYGIDEVNRIISSTGIKQIRVANENQCASDLCTAAAERLFSILEIDPSTIDGLVFVTQTPDYKMPATSSILQHKLGLPTTAVTFDINYGCSGYVYGLYQASMLISSGGCNKVLVCVGDVTTKLVHPRDRSVRMVFGDAGSATLVERGENTSYFNLKTDGSGAKHLIIPAGGSRNPFNDKTSIPYETYDGNVRSQETVHMDGMEIMSFALREVPIMVDELLEYADWDKKDVGIFALHQANKFMLDYLRRKMKLNKTSVPIAVETVGNTGPASIPLMLSLKSKELREGKQLDKVICCGFGVGLSWAACTLDLSSTVILEPIEC